MPDVRCSITIELCYETSYGFVWDINANNGQGSWATPPTNVADCGAYVFWPLIDACYDPESGYGYNPAEDQWFYVGENYRLAGG